MEFERLRRTLAGYHCENGPKDISPAMAASPSLKSSCPKTAVVNNSADDTLTNESVPFDRGHHPCVLIWKDIDVDGMAHDGKHN